jgi:hypothetical protein
MRPTVSGQKPGSIRASKYFSCKFGMLVLTDPPLQSHSAEDSENHNPAAGAGRLQIHRFDMEVAMSRHVFAALVAILIPALSSADQKRTADGRKPSNGVIPAHMAGEAKPANCQKCAATSIYPEWMSNGHAPLHANGHGSFGDELRHQLLWDAHECAPDGCIKPLGCGNLWTEIKFIFGSCRQFFGTAESTVGHHRNTRNRFETPYR